MKKMKYGMTAVCLAVGMMLAVTACGGKKTESTETEDSDCSYVVETQTMKVQTETVKQRRKQLCLPAKCTVI